MIVKLIKDPRIDQDRLELIYQEMNNQISQLIEIANGSEPFIIGEKNERQVKIEYNDVLYFEAVDKKVFFYTKKEVFFTKYNLKQIEELFSNYQFIRISKSMIVNLFKVTEIKADANMKLMVYLKNKEAIMITRHYRNAFYQAIKKLSLESESE